MRLPLALILCVLPSLASAGAWPRAEGETYVNLSHEGGEDGWTAIYAERGVRGDRTLGIDIGGHVAGGALALRRGDLSAEMDGRVMAFLRVPIAPPPGTGPDWRLAGTLGVGADIEHDSTGQEVEPRIRLGLAAGRGIATDWGDGWLSAEMRAEPGADGMRLGAAAVIGIRPLHRLTLSAGLFAEVDDEADPVATFAPTISYDVPRLGEVHVGLRAKTDGLTMVLGISRAF
jgi:hypothetical protein